MNKKTIWTIIVIVIILVIIGIVASKSDKTAPATTNIPPVIVATSTPVGTSTTTGPVVKDNSNLIVATNPKPNQTISSPLEISGKARGNWFFEASFPAALYDANGKEIARIPIQAVGEWMTTEFVPFKSTLTFTKPTTKTGTLVLEKDNPTGLPEHNNKIEIPVVFQ